MIGTILYKSYYYNYLCHARALFGRVCTALIVDIAHGERSCSRLDDRIRLKDQQESPEPVELV
jgi:hypothetical protein